MGGLREPGRLAAATDQSLAVAIVILLFLGCSGRPSDQPPLAPVRGVVTLDGQPVEGKHVIFAPENGRASMGTTNEHGEYKLMYTNKWEGAIIGPHQITVSTPVPARDGVPYEENIPAKYNLETTLKADVKEGQNVIDLPLESE